MKDQNSQRGRALVERAHAALSTASATFSGRRENESAEQREHRTLAAIGRLASHAAIVFVSIVALILAGLRFGAADSGPVSDSIDSGSGLGGSLGRSPTILLGRDRLNGNTNPSAQPQAGAFGGEGAIVTRDAGIMLPAAVAAPGQPGSETSGNIPSREIEKRSEITTYRVQPGDAIVSIAQRFGLSPNTIAWSNPALEDNPDFLRIGQEITILPVDGVYYTIKNGDTLAALSKRFKVEETAIQNYPLNNLGGGLIAGTQIIIPEGIKPEAQQARAPVAPVARRAAAVPAAVGSGAATGSFSWPTQGAITQGFWAYHRALDIANSIGTPIYASDGGFVTYAGWSNVGYGYMVLVDHGNGFRTLYGHLSYYYVDQGQYVSKGQVLGQMGSTGNSTGPHLHFEIRYGGATQNPYSYLP
jgi:murein DD-endopeptidase MepM/ murein hydrolase activator NlpD